MQRSTSLRDPQRLAPWLVVLGLVCGCGQGPPQHPRQDVNCNAVQVTRQHPYLAFNRDDIPALRARATRPPYKEWMDIVRENAVCGMRFTPGQRNPPCPWPDPPPGTSCSFSTANESESCQSGYALNLALAGLIDDNSDYIDKAASLLQEAGEFNLDWNTLGWEWGGDLLNYAFAYDFIEPELSRADNETILGRFFQSLAKTTPKYFRSSREPYVTNTRIRVASGAGTLAYAMNGYGPTACWAAMFQRDLFSKNTNLFWLFEPYIPTTVTHAGTFNEGPAYQNDSSATLLPYLFVIKKLQGRDYINGVNTLPRWEGDDRIAKMFVHDPALSMPDRNAATYATGWRWGFTNGNVAAPGIAPPGDRVSQWFFDWTDGSGPINQVSMAYAFLYADASLPSQEPTRSQVTRDWSSFRSSFNDDATYLLMQSEHWPQYSTHGQPDQTSFVLYAKNQYLLIDPGDGRSYCGPGDPQCPGRQWLNFSPAAHNLVIVDGLDGCNDDAQTPSRLYGTYTKKRDPTYLLASFITPELDSAMVKLDPYHSVKTVGTYRTAMMARGRYAVLFDNMVTSNNHSHTYDAQLHFGGLLDNPESVCVASMGSSTSSCRVVPTLRQVNRPPEEFPLATCGSDTGDTLPEGVTDCGRVRGDLTLGTDRLTWRTPSSCNLDVELDAVYAPAPQSFTPHDGRTNVYPNAVFKHPFIKARYEGSTTQWVNVLYPTYTGEEAPAITPRRVLGGAGGALAVALAADGSDDLAIVSDGKARIQVPGEADFRGRAALLLRARGVVQRAHVHEASDLTAAGKPLFSASLPVHAALSWRGSVAIADVVAPSAARVCLTTTSPAAPPSLDGKPHPGDRGPNGLVCVEVPPGRHTLESP